MGKGGSKGFEEAFLKQNDNSKTVGNYCKAVLEDEVLLAQAFSVACAL